jgi:cytochrome c-type biogenesis protein CcmH
MFARHTVFAWLLTVTFVAVAGAQAPSPKQQAADMAGQLMSPFCPGRLLSDCTSPDAGALRQDIAARIAAGETAAAVKADLVKQHGSEILGAPEAAGVGWLAWLVPGILGLVSCIAIGVKVARATRMAPAPALAVAGVTDARLLTQLDDELRDLD